MIKDREALTVSGQADRLAAINFADFLAGSRVAQARVLGTRKGCEFAVRYKENGIRVLMSAFQCGKLPASSQIPELQRVQGGC